MAEDEAALTASGALAEQAGMARQDSARDIGDSLRSLSPASRRAAPRESLCQICCNFHQILKLSQCLRVSLTARSGDLCSNASSYSSDACKDVSIN